MTDDELASWLRQHVLFFYIFDKTRYLEPTGVALDAWLPAEKLVNQGYIHIAYCNTSLEKDSIVTLTQKGKDFLWEYYDREAALVSDDYPIRQFAEKYIMEQKTDKDG